MQIIKKIDGISGGGSCQCTPESTFSKYISKEEISNCLLSAIIQSMLLAGKFIKNITSTATESACIDECCKNLNQKNYIYENVIYDCETREKLGEIYMHGPLIK